MLRTFGRRVVMTRSTVSSSSSAFSRGFHATRPAMVQSVGSWTWHEDFSNIVKGVLRWGPSLTLKKLMHMKEIRIGELVGVDHIGNHYYENRDYQYGRHRWVEHAGLPWYSEIEPSNVPTEWYGWLHHMTDLPGNSLLLHEGAQFTDKDHAIYDHNLGGVAGNFVKNNTQVKQRGFEDGNVQEDLYWKQVGHPRRAGGQKSYKVKVEEWSPNADAETEEKSEENIHNRLGVPRSLKET